MVPVYGRTFPPDEYQEDRSQVVLLSYPVWYRRFGANPSVVGQNMFLNSKAYTIVGVLPPTFHVPVTYSSLVDKDIRDTEILVPLPHQFNRIERSLAVFGRLKPETHVDHVRTRLDGIIQQFRSQDVEPNTTRSVLVESLQRSLVGDLRPTLLLLFGAVSFVLLIACANVANLQIARLSSRTIEFSIRSALGASRWRVEINTLGQTLRDQRLGALEATALLRTVMMEIEVAVFAFDGEQRLRLANHKGELLLAQPMERLLGRRADELGLADCLRDNTPQPIQRTFPGGTGRWEVRRRSFRAHGVPHQLLVLTDLSKALREEERLAWQRLVRVLGHELNKSLAPIVSIAGSLEQLLTRHPRPDDWKEDMRRGVSIIASRADALNRFMNGYARLARLPQPQRRSIVVGDWMRRVVSLETRLPVILIPGTPLTIHADGDQLEQALINLIRNAADAALETHGSVVVGWTTTSEHLHISVRDDGPGLFSTANLFTPFFTTKPGGSGIGLVLSRQIVENHRGTLTIANRAGGPGCEARVELPRAPRDNAPSLPRRGWGEMQFHPR